MQQILWNRADKSVIVLSGIVNHKPALNPELKPTLKSELVVLKSGFYKLICMRCVQKSLVLSSNLVGFRCKFSEFNLVPIQSRANPKKISTKKISFSLAFHVNSFTRAHVSKLIGQRLFFKTLSAHPLALFGLSLMWIISVCSLYLKLRIRQASTAIACICAKSSIMIFGWCIFLVSVVSVKRIKSAGIKCLLMMCMAAVARII